MQAYSKKQCTRVLSSRLNLSFHLLLHIFAYLEDAQGIGKIQQLCRYTRRWKKEVFHHRKVDYVMKEFHILWQKAKEKDEDFFDGTGLVMPTRAEVSDEWTLQDRNIPVEVEATLAKVLKMNISSLMGINFIEDYEIGDEGMKVIASALRINTTLHYLNLGLGEPDPDHRMGDVAAMVMADALKNNTTLRKIYLPDNNIGDRGAIAMGELLRVNTSLSNLYLECTKIGDDGIKAFMEALWAARSSSKRELYIFLVTNLITVELNKYILANDDKFQYMLDHEEVEIWCIGSRNRSIHVRSCQLWNWE